MRKTLFPLLLCAALLCGCAAQNPAVEPTVAAAPSLPEPVISPEQPDYLEKLDDDGILSRYLLHTDVSGILPLGEDLLLFSGEEKTALILLDSQTLHPTARYDTQMPLMQNNSTVQLLTTGIAYYDEHTLETVVLDPALREIRRIDAPEDMIGIPQVSSDGRTLYYCTSTAIRALDPDTGISRILKEAAYPVQAVSGVLLEDQVLQVSIAEADGTRQTLFLSTQTGQLLHSAEGNLLPQTSGSRFFLQNTAYSLFCGSAEGSTMVLQPLHGDLGCWYLPDGHQAVACGLENNHTILELYDLDSGRRCAELSLDGTLLPEHLIRTADGTVWFLVPGDQGKMLLQWDPAASAIMEDTVYLRPRYTREEPDYDGLAACSLYARQLSEKHGIEILVYKDAAAQEPWDYHLDYEYQAAVLQRELERRLPERGLTFLAGFLQTLRDTFTALKICIVRGVEGSPESGSPEAVNGIQFMDGFDAYIVLSTAYDTEYALYHELSHLMETVVLTESTGYDRGENLNPDGFRYDNDYAANAGRDGSAWLQPGKEYFIDTYSMSYAKEDRARLFEYAMTAGHETLFASPRLQDKLRQMCIGIREGFGLEDSAESFRWEQYLLEPFAPTE